MIAAARAEGPTFGGVFDAGAIVELSRRLVESTDGAMVTAVAAAGSERTADFAPPFPRIAEASSPMMTTAHATPAPIHIRCSVRESSLFHHGMYQGGGVGIFSVGA